ncbi:Uncharacterised protein [Streptococcus pneumoniae]|nr:Uncharacterised protein [Streptococcus pneumoniae]
MATFPIDNLKLINKVPLGEMSIFFDFLIYLHASGILYIG